MKPIHDRPARLAMPLAAAAMLLAPTATPLAAQAPAESFVITVGADTFAVESFTRTADRVQGEIGGRALGRVAYTLSLGADAVPTALVMRAWAPGAAAEASPTYEGRLDLRGDTVLAEMARPEGPARERFNTRAGAVPYLNPSFVMIEQVVRRARAVGGDSVDVPLFLVQGGQTPTATVMRRGADSVLIVMAGLEIRAAASAEGGLLGGSIPAQGLSFVRRDGALPTTGVVERPDYSAPEGAPYTAEEVVVRTASGHTLAGTLTRPRTAGRVPAMVTISGSGPQDRDASLSILPRYRPFREIADTLARRGIAVLRLDDRGTGASTGSFAGATTADFADDVRAALAYLRARPDVDAGRLGLIGHSEGGLIVPMVAATDTALRAAVVVAGPARTGREILRFQQRSMIDRAPGLSAAGRDSAFAAAQTALDTEAARQPWLRFFLDHDPLPTAGKVRRTPVLVLHGETDRQVTAEQAEALAEAFRAAGNRDVTVRVLPEVNHLLLRDPDGDPSRYTTLPSREVAPEVLGVLAEWVSSRLGR